MVRWKALVAIAAVGAAALAAASTRAGACMCDVDNDTAKVDAEALASHDLAFDGWVLRREATQGACPLPPAPPPKRGCFRVRIHQKPDCTPMTYPAARLDAAQGIDFYASSAGASNDGVTELCGVKKGRYMLTAALTRWATDPDGTLEHGIVIDFDPAVPASYSAVAEPGGGWIVVPVTALKGTVAGRERVVAATTCPRYLLPYTAYRFFGEREADGRIRITTCSTRNLTDDEIATMVRRPPAPAPTTPSPAAPVAPPPRASSSDGCSTHRDAPGALLLAIVVLGLGRRSAHQRARGRRADAFDR